MIINIFFSHYHSVEIEKTEEERPMVIFENKQIDNSHLMSMEKASYIGWSLFGYDRYPYNLDNDD